MSVDKGKLLHQEDGKGGADAVLFARVGVGFKLDKNDFKMIDDLVL